MTSRLDRLVTLLETGSTQLIRNTAAQQLGDVQKQHPDELFNLLTRVIPFLKSKSWDTRTAAAKAIAGIVENASLFDPNADEGFKRDEDVQTETKDETSSPNRTLLGGNQLQLDTLDITTILINGKKLLGSGGKEADYAVASMDPAARLQFQKRAAFVSLGLSGADVDGQIAKILEEMDVAPANGTHIVPTLPKVDTSDSMMDETVRSPSPFTAMSPGGNPAPTPSNESGLSKRQLNQLKRKMKTEAKSQSSKVRIVDLSGRRPSSNTPTTPANSEPFAIKSGIKAEITDEKDTDMFSFTRANIDEDAKIISDFKGSILPEKSILQTEEEEQGLEWPFERLCEVLMVDLFDHHWEVRHGAAMGLREVVRVHGAGAGREHGKSRASNDKVNKQWLDDLASRLCCVLMLDRFGDYISDNVVAPIRETVGQTLGALMVHLSPDTVSSVYHVLYRMVMQENLLLETRIWEVCHGGMIGLRYLVAIRSDLLVKDNGLMDGVVEAVMKGLADYDDDVRAVSAATLIPIAKEFVALRPTALDNLMNIVWDCLSDLRDDLSASTGFVMDLLAKLCSFPEVLVAMQQNAAKDSEHSFTNLVPRLYPFLRHTITSVRSAVLRALKTFLEIGGDDTRGWVNGKILRLVYQNFLVERNEVTLNLSFEVWNALVDGIIMRNDSQASLGFLEHFPDFLVLALHPIGTSRNSLPIELCYFVKPSGQLYGPPNPEMLKAAAAASQQAAEPPAKRRKKSEKKEEPPTSAHNVDGHMISGDVDLVGLETLIRSRLYAAKAFANALARYPAQNQILEKISEGLQSPYSTTQMVTGMILEEYAKALGERKIPWVDGGWYTDLLSILDADRPNSYTDILPFLRIVRAQCQALLNAFRDHGHVPSSRLPSLAIVVQGEVGAGPTAFSIANADTVINTDFERLKKSLAPAQRITSLQALNDARNAAIQALDEAKRVKSERDIRIRGAAASALVAIGDIPKKPSSLIKGIMDSIKSEENVELQKRSAASIASLLGHYATAQRRGPADKVTANLMSFYCIDTAETPEFRLNAKKHDAILSLHKEEDRKDYADTVAYEKEARAARVTRRGTKEALDQLCHLFGDQLFDKAPVLKSRIESPLRQAFGSDAPTDVDDEDFGQEVVDGLSILRTLVPTMNIDLHSFVVELMPLVARAMRSPLSVFRYAAAKCFATICSVLRIDGMSMLVEHILPHANSDDLHCRQGAIEVVYHLISVMEDSILPYVIFLIVPVLGRMSDSDNDVRLISTTTFATLVKLVPLEAGIPDPPGFPESLLKGRDRERKFISQMLDFKKVEPFELPVAIKAELRTYQQDGVNWLAFLNRYHLHGILCDDMGLGKTLQTLCIVASDHHLRAEEYAKTQSSDCRRLPSLIVCPPTLSGHWQQEIQQFAPFLSCLAYVGPASERTRLREQIGTTDVVITSYDICRNDIDVFTPFSWNYCVLDEGHLIKNPKAKTSMAVKCLASNHRLILSGTPIQNNVLELWSLFDFLMPGFLGTEKVFLDRFAKPIAASRFSKSSSKEQEAGALAIEALHKQVLPFLLRRLKEEVLDDLPPKILQNYYCDLSDLQKKLFEEFAKKERKNLADKAGSESREDKQHIFQALQYMRKLCNSPSLVVKEDHKQYAAIQAQLARQHSSLKDVAHAPKLTALRDLLVDCGIGTDPAENNNYISPHRALIFCQMKEMLDIVANDVLRALLPSVQYLRLDGSVEANKRQNIVNQFNTDPSYDCLLLTTSVGGLGLNLTGADTVIFVEHDWNPQKDLQAMDRAHRIGQKKVVNVYRLVTRGTLEEKILNLQRFKIDVASTVVNQQNAGLATMETDQILDLFNLGETAPAASSGGAVDIEGKEEDLVDVETGDVKQKGKKGWLDDLGELWDERGYEEEFDLGGFLKTMKM
ncbi:TATA-binding protein-associated factor, partial [Lecanoromycetidae sp. Uapishka_2]